MDSILFADSSGVGVLGCGAGREPAVSSPRGAAGRRARRGARRGAGPSLLARGEPLHRVLRRARLHRVGRVAGRFRRPRAVLVPRRAPGRGGGERGIHRGLEVAVALVGERRGAANGSDVKGRLRQPESLEWVHVPQAVD